MLLIMVGNMASHLYTSIHCKGGMPMYSFFSHLLHTLPFTSPFPSLRPCGHFHGSFHLQLSEAQCTSGACAFHSSRWKSWNQSHWNLKLKSQDEHTSFLFLPCWRSYNTKCRHSLCWCSQNARGMYFHCFDWEMANIIFHAHLIMMIYTIHVSVDRVECFVADLLESHFDLISCLCEQHFLGFEFVLTSLIILLSCQTVVTKFELPSWYDL